MALLEKIALSAPLINLAQSNYLISNKMVGDPSEGTTTLIGMGIAYLLATTIIFGSYYQEKIKED